MPFSKIFPVNKDQPEANSPTINWIEVSDNRWGIRLLDLRPITQGWTSTSKDIRMAENAISYGGEDGTIFIDQEPESKNEITCDIPFSVDPILAPGALFIPGVMEHKWAIYFHQNRVIFVRSWLRKVLVIAETFQHDGKLHVYKIRGQYFDDTKPEFIRAITKFLLISHAMGEEFPAPLPKKFSSDPKSAAVWAFSMYGNMAHYGTFNADFEGSTLSPIRSDSLLHIAVARSDLGQIDAQFKSGIPIDLLATDGLAPLHWSVVTKDTRPMQRLIELGANPDVRSVQGATPLMNAVQSNKIEHLSLLISQGAAVNASDNRGFTSLHRAAELGRVELAEILLKNGADPNVEAQGYAALEFAERRGNNEIIRLLRGE